MSTSDVLSIVAAFLSAVATCLALVVTGLAFWLSKTQRQELQAERLQQQADAKSDRERVTLESQLTRQSDLEGGYNQLKHHMDNLLDINASVGGVVAMSTAYYKRILTPAECAKLESARAALSGFWDTFVFQCKRDLLPPRISDDVYWKHRAGRYL